MRCLFRSVKGSRLKILGISTRLSEKRQNRRKDGNLNPKEQKGEKNNNAVHVSLDDFIYYTLWLVASIQHVMADIFLSLSPNKLALSKGASGINNVIQDALCLHNKSSFFDVIRNRKTSNTTRLGY